jgi:hypothetical protein
MALVLVSLMSHSLRMLRRAGPYGLLLSTMHRLVHTQTQSSLMARCDYKAKAASKVFAQRQSVRNCEGSQ